MIGARIAHQQKLAISGGRLEQLYTDHIQFAKIERLAYPIGKLIIIAFTYGVPVASCLVHNEVIMIYVHASYRRCGIGTMLYQRAMRARHRTNHFRAFVNSSIEAREFFGSIWNIPPATLAKRSAVSAV